LFDRIVEGVAPREDEGIPPISAGHCEPLSLKERSASLAPKAFDVLRYLVKYDRLVSQEEIPEALWPDTYVNSEVVKKYVLNRKV
jgi:DNA-binding response OmpR family regulator